MEIGDRCPSALDESYERYAKFVIRNYGFAPASKTVWIQVNRGISNRSHVTGIRLLSGPEHKRTQRARAAASALQSLTEA